MIPRWSGLRLAVFSLKVSQNLGEGAASVMLLATVHLLIGQRKLVSRRWTTEPSALVSTDSVPLRIENLNRFIKVCKRS
jgi:hypothetical protein